MQKESVAKPEIKLVGLTARTNNKNEMNPATSKIGELAGRYWSQNIASRISDRKNAGVTYSVYTSTTATNMAITHILSVKKLTRSIPFHPICRS